MEILLGACSLVGPAKPAGHNKNHPKAQAHLQPGSVEEMHATCV